MENKLLIAGSAVAVAAAAGFALHYWLNLPKKVPHLSLEETEWFKDPRFQAITNLKVEEAKERSHLIKYVQYALNLVLPRGEEYGGSVEIRFVLNKPGHLFIDYSGTEVGDIVMNGIRLDATKIFTRHRITLPKESQIKGENIVQIAFKNEYSRNWNGLYYFHDPEDNEEYIYNCFEPFFANKAFPCFDQPDLKASMRLCTITPEKWLVITNEYYEEIYPGREALSGKLKAVKFPEFLLNLINEPCTLRVFKPTEEISTYLYSITAGPYKEYSGKSEKGLPPLRIFARQAMAKYMDKVAENVFSYTINGLNFFKEFFNSPFPYTKHDQIFIPDFKYDGMEHAGAVLLNEKFIRKDVLSKYDMMSLAETILHQVSHMWFGDLVTLRWWNDLWLNESFAVFMAFLALSKAKGFEIFHLEAWTVFRKELVEAYREDQERTTHPIETPVNNTEEAENLFDSITYWKGASVLKQLYYFLDESVFRQGIMEYFVKYKGKNTDLADFIGCMKVALKKFNKEADLNNWVDLWLTKKGVSQLKPEMKFFNDVITDFNIIQTTSTYGDNVCRMHRLDIALYDSAFTETLISSAYVAPQPSCSIKSIIGKPKPFAVMLNVNDFTYAKVQLDDISLNAFQHCMTLIPNELTKTLIWQSVWDMVRDGLFGASTFLKFVATQIAQENSVHIFNLALDYATVTVTEYVPDKYKPEEASKMFEAIKTRILSEKGVDNKRHLLKHITEFAYTIGSKKVLLDWLKNQESILGIKIPLPIRYEIIKLLYKAKEDNIPMEEKKELLEKELSNDKSEEGVYAQLACTASLPDPKIKEKLWNWYKDETVKESEQVLLASMSSFWCWEQMDILEKYAKEFFGGVDHVFKTRSRHYAECYFQLLKPKICSEEVLKNFDLLEGIIDEEQNTFKLLVRKEIDKRKRIKAIQSTYLTGPSRKGSN